MLAWRNELADRCPGCGTQSYEEAVFEAHSLKCLNCMRLEMKRADVYETDPPAAGKAGVHIVLRRSDAES